MQGAEVLTRFTADTKDFDSKVKGLNTSVGSIAKGILIATGVTKALGTAFNMISGQMDNAIKRFDTMNNFPKVMSNLGISAQDSQKAIDKMSKKLKGLPTTLDSAALSVQRLTSKNGNIKESTDLFLAMNNAILAGGASSQIQQSAIEQLSQAYAKGKPDMMEWRTLMTAMPAQLKQVAKAMGYVNADQLGEDLREGVVSMDDFMKTIDKLNKEGGSGFKSFEEQARNATGGIETSITNMKTAITKGLTNIMSSINRALEKTPFGSIGNIISKIGTMFEDGLTKIGKEIEPILSGLLSGSMSVEKATSQLTEKFLNTITNGIDRLIPHIPEFVKTFMEVLSGLVDGVSKSLPTLIPKLVEALMTLSLEISKEENLQKFVDAGWNLGEAVIKGIFNALKQKGSDPKAWFTILRLGVTGLPGMLFQLLVRETMSKIGGFFSSIWSMIRAKIDWLKHNTTGEFKKIVNDFINVGKNAIKGFILGMTGMTGQAIITAANIGAKALSALRKKLGVKSPSKEFAIIGKYSVLGYTEGLDKMQKQVQSQIAETFSISPQLATTTGMHYSPNVQVYNNVDVRQDPLGQMVNNIKTYSGGAKNDYNYGAGF